MVKKTFINLGLLLAFGLATAMFNSCGPDCDPADPQSECYVPPCDPTDPNGDCYEPPIVAVESVTLDTVSLTLCEGEDYTITAAVLPEDADDQTVTWTSSKPAVVSVEDGVVTALVVGTATITAKAGDKLDVCVVTVILNPLSYVEINGIKWALRNIDKPGIFASTPESSGMFYQWNRKIGWSFSDEMVNSDGGIEWATTIPKGTRWVKSNDPCPIGWRVPTDEEQLTLLDTEKVQHEWLEQNGVFGRVFTDKVSSKTLFLPAAGARNDSDGTLKDIVSRFEDIDDNGTLYDVGKYGHYWSSTQRDVVRAYGLHFNGYKTDLYHSLRRYGFSVRCVAE